MFFQNVELRSIAIRDSQLIAAMGGLVVLDVVVLVIWSLSFPYTVHDSSSVDCVASSGRHALCLCCSVYIVIKCSYGLHASLRDSGTIVMIVVQVFIKGSISAYGAYLTYLIRNAPSAYNER